MNFSYSLTSSIIVMVHCTPISMRPIEVITFSALFAMNKIFK